MQTIDHDGNQYEVPDIWLTNGNPWEIRRDDLVYPIKFYGEVKDGKWTPGELVRPIPPPPLLPPPPPSFVRLQLMMRCSVRLAKCMPVRVEVGGQSPAHVCEFFQGFVKTVTGAWLLGLGFVSHSHAYASASCRRGRRLSSKQGAVF